VRLVAESHTGRNRQQHDHDGDLEVGERPSRQNGTERTYAATRRPAAI
jgi:hypothetical protein